MFRILFYLFSIAFLASGIYNCIKIKKEKQEKVLFIVAAIFHFVFAMISFYFAQWGFIVI